jgi:hypothetical protein
MTYVLDPFPLLSAAGSNALMPKPDSFARSARYEER